VRERKTELGNIPRLLNNIDTRTTGVIARDFQGDLSFGKLVEFKDFLGVRGSLPIILSPTGPLHIL
jgi:hypothetical protein